MISHQVGWWDVHLYVSPLLAAAVSWPMIGTPAWCQLDDTDPAKVAAVYDAAQHWALRVETAQEARAEASRDISAAEDWGAVARGIRRHADAVRSGAYIPRVVI
nr:DUF2742 domain-containing protein [Mycobacterium kansasii]